MLKKLFGVKEKSDMPSASLLINGVSVIIFGSHGDTYFSGLSATPERNMSEHFAAFNDELHKLPLDAVVIDVGANIGLTVAAASKRLNRGKVYGVEPSPKAFAALKEMTRVNALSNVVLVNKALGEMPGTVPFIESEMLAGSYVGSHAREASTVDVDMTTLDALVADLRLDRLDLVKIDVEGFELDVLKGATETIKRFRPRFVVEFNSFAIACDRNQSPRELADFVLDTFGEFRVTRHGVSYPVSHDKSVRDFIYANMASFRCVEDIVFGGISEPASP